MRSNVPAAAPLRGFDVFVSLLFAAVLAGATTLSVRSEESHMINVMDVMPVLAFAMIIVLLPLLSDEPPSR
jgi:hypothetical protein